MDDRRFLTWVHDRLVNVYAENPNTDFVRRLKKIAGGEVHGLESEVLIGATPFRSMGHVSVSALQAYVVVVYENDTWRSRIFQNKNTIEYKGLPHFQFTGEIAQ